jgi:fructose-bisphosphate aldolase, class II
MTTASTGDLVAAARAERRAVAAFNAITLEHAEAIAEAASAAGVPVILQISENAVRYHGALRPFAVAAAEVARAASVPIAVHLDHVTDPALAEAALDAPVSSLMYDAGALPYAENVAQTAAVARRSQQAGLWVVAELGYVGGKPGAATSAHAAGVRTDPDEASRFVADTGVDALAVAVGSSHAMTERTARLDVDLIARLCAAVPVPLVLHGSSGVPADELRAAVAAGMVKINVGTALSKAFTGGVRAALEADPALVEPRRYLAAGRDATVAAVTRLLGELGSLG